MNLYIAENVKVANAPNSDHEIMVLKVLNDSMFSPRYPRACEYTNEPPKNTITMNGDTRSIAMITESLLKRLRDFCTFHTLLNTFSTFIIIQITIQKKRRAETRPTALL